jgi:leader peptidase (prepilin peptidase) / N-methyltransferase
VSWAFAFAVGIAAGWYVPVLARAMPSRQVGDRARLATWSSRQRIILSAAGSVGIMLLVVRVGVDARSVAAVGLAPLLLTVAAVDIRTERLPDRLVMAGLVVAALGGMIVAWDVRAAGLGPVLGVAVRAAIGACGFAGILGVVHRVRPGGMGAGDVKLAIVLGCFVGVSASTNPAAFRQVLAAIVIASAVTLVTGMAMNARRRCSLRSAVPFGPGLVAGTWIVMLVATAPTA